MVLRRKTLKKRLRRKRKSHVTQRRRPRGMQVMNPRTNNPFPARNFCKMYYAENLTFNVPILGLGQENTYALNGIFDPDITGGGHQPYGRDTMATIYNQYKVAGCMCEIVWTDPTADNVVVGFQVQGSATAGVIGSALMERPYSKYKALNNTGSQQVSLKFYVPNYKALGVTKLQWKANTSTYSALSGANPAVTSLLRLTTFNQNVGAPAAAVSCIIKLTYFCEWFDRFSLAQS